MATITTANSGSWSTATTWTGGVVPTSNDYAVISTNHDVIFNYDYSTLKSGLARVSIGGSLTCTNSSGLWTLMVNGPIDGTGTLAAGTSLLNPLPVATTFVIHLNTNNNTTAMIKSPSTTPLLNVQLFCGIPDTLFGKIIANASAGATSVTLDRDINLTSNDRFVWSTNARIAVINVNKGRSVEYRTITNVVGRTLTFTPSITAKSAGAYVIPAKRNIQIKQYLNGGSAAPTFLRILGGSNLGYELVMPRNASNNGITLQNSANVTFNGATIFYTLSGGITTLAQITPNLRLYKTVSTGSYNTFSNYVAGLFIDESIITDTRSTVFGWSGGFARKSYLLGLGLMAFDAVVGSLNFTDCVFEGNTSLMRAGTLQQYNNCLFRRNGYTLGEPSYAGYSYGLNGIELKGCQFTSNNVDFVLAAVGRSYAYNTQFLSPSTVIPTAPTVPVRQSPPYSLLISYSNNGLDDNLRAWSWGGNITTDTTKNLKNDGKSASYKWTLTDSSRYTLMEHYYRMNVREKARWEIHAQQSMVGMVEPLKIVLFDNKSEPFLNSNDAVISTWTIPNNTDIHRHVIEYNNTGGDTSLILRLYARHGTGNIWHNVLAYKQPYKQINPGKEWIQMSGQFS